MYTPIVTNEEKSVNYTVSLLHQDENCYAEGAEKKKWYVSLASLV